MPNAPTTGNSILVDIYVSFRSLPAWVQIWVAILLAPVNIATLFFLDQPMGVWIAVLAFAGMLPNIPIMLADRGSSKRMAIPHVLFWGPMLALLVFARPEAVGGYAVFLWVLLAVNGVSTCFDSVDVVKWLNGDRLAAGR